VERREKKNSSLYGGCKLFLSEDRFEVVRVDCGIAVIRRECGQTLARVRVSQT